MFLPAVYLSMYRLNKKTEEMLHIFFILLDFQLPKTDERNTLTLFHKSQISGVLAMYHGPTEVHDIWPGGPQNNQ